MCNSTKSPRSSLPAKLLAVILSAWMPSIHATDLLPVFIADNHAETFGWITRTFDPDDAFTLVLVDAHSDASAAERSEEIREQLRRVPSEQARAGRISKWRANGRIQAFNWIEPLMPRPIDQVFWIADVQPGDAERKSQEAISALDGRLEFEPRSSGSFAHRWRTSDTGAFHEWNPGRRPVILAVDLDFFAGMKTPEREEIFHSIWKHTLAFPELKGIAFSISRPWLKDHEEADALVHLALKAIRQTRGARLEIDATIDDSPDHSLKAGELSTSSQPIPRWDLAQASARTKGELALLADRVTIKDRKRDWSHPAPPAIATIAPQSSEIDTDGVWRFPLHQEPTLRLQAPEAATGKVRWHLLRSASPAYDLIPATGLGKGFSEKPSRWIYEESHTLGETTDFLLSPSTWRNEDGGTFRIAAEYETPDGWISASPVELRIRKSEGFRGALSECQNMPYVFGVAGISANDLSGVESGWGSDCSNLLVYGWRRNGYSLSWGDPGQLRRQLATKAENLRPDHQVPITQDEIERGIAIDFGKHVAAVWEDRPPLGILDGNDLPIHHLGGRPEIIPLHHLTASRPDFSLRVPHSPATCSIAFAGDIVLAGEERVEIPEVAGIRSDFFFANLEGIPSLLESHRKPRYDFRFSPDRLALLKERKISAVSLANNHALDAGKKGLLEGIDALRSRGIAVVGAGANATEACSPLRLTNASHSLTLFGICHVGEGAAGPHAPGICMLPQHAALLDQELRKARAKGEKIIILIHGGDEYDTKVNEDQRRWARWLVARGAAIIAGAHPHVIQREELHGGAAILHSLGNAVYPKSLKGADSGTVRILQIPVTRP